MAFTNIKCCISLHFLKRNPYIYLVNDMCTQFMSLKDI